LSVKRRRKLRGMNPLWYSLKSCSLWRMALWFMICLRAWALPSRSFRSRTLLQRQNVSRGARSAGESRRVDRYVSKRSRRRKERYVSAVPEPPSSSSRAKTQQVARIAALDSPTCFATTSVIFFRK